MSIKPGVSNLNKLAPPPSPIPTGKGSRSAANEILSDYLEKSLHVPNLTLPDPHIPITTHHHHHQILPTEINYRLLESRDIQANDLLLRSAREFGAFTITCHGVSGEELQSLIHKADQVFRVLEERDTGFRRVFGDRDNENKEHITWVRSKQDRMEWAREFIGDETYRDFSEKMENISSKLDAIAQQLCSIFVENMDKMRIWKGIQGKESLLNLYRYNQKNKVELNSLLADQRNNEPPDHTLCLHIPSSLSQFFVQTARGPLSFDAGPDTIVVTVGKRIEDWSLGELKCVSGEVICEPRLQGSQASFSVELKCFSLNFDLVSKRNCYIITIRDQILIGLIIGFLYKIWVFLYS